jgi:hypothetical protein
VSRDAQAREGDEDPAVVEESEARRLERNLNELLGELRVVLPGVQVLFAFLLTVPFTQRFDSITGFQEKVYFATLLSTAIASGLLMAPTAHHRLRFRQGERRQIIDTGNRLAIAGLTFLALAMSGVVMLVTDVLFGTATTVVTTAIAVLVFAAVWYAIPFARWLRDRRAA